MIDRMQKLIDLAFIKRVISDLLLLMMIIFSRIMKVLEFEFFSQFFKK